jgi:hypothetical protein
MPPVSAFRHLSPVPSILKPGVHIFRYRSGIPAYWLFVRFVPVLDCPDNIQSDIGILHLGQGINAGYGLVQHCAQLYLLV